MITTEQELRDAFASNHQAGNVLFVPGPDLDLDPDGRIIIAESVRGWAVYRLERGEMFGYRRFTDKVDALNYAYRKWVLHDAGA